MPLYRIVRKSDNEEVLRELGYTDLLPEGMTVGDKRFFTDGDTARLWVRVVPEA